MKSLAIIHGFHIIIMTSIFTTLNAPGHLSKYIKNGLTKILCEISMGMSQKHKVFLQREVDIIKMLHPYHKNLGYISPCKSNLSNLLKSLPVC